MLIKRGVKDYWKAFLGLIILIYGIISIFNINEGISQWYTSNLIFEIILILIGSIYIRHTIKQLKKLSWNELTVDFAISFFVLFFGLFPLLIDYGLLDFLSFAIEFSPKPLVFAVILVSFGAYLVVDLFLLLFNKHSQE